MMSKMAHGIVLNKRSALLRLEASTKLALSFNLPAYARCFSISTFRKCPVENIITEHFNMLPIQNERMLQYKAGSDERNQLKAELKTILNKIEPVPIVINGKEIFKKCELAQIIPYNIEHFIARYSHANRELIDRAISSATQAQQKWDKTTLRERMAIWEKAANLIATKYRFKIVAATMLGQGKTLCQAEMDLVELVDFMRINPIFLRDLANYEPVNGQPESCRNHMVLRGLSGFVAAISPFNYTSIAGNLAYTPALMGNAVLWKPSDSAVLSNWYVFQAMREAGVPEGVVNFVPAEPTVFSTAVTCNPDLAGIHFTGTSAVLKLLWKMVGQRIDTYKNYPRLVGDCGGKNFHFVHPSANPEVAVACTVRAAFEYAGQKCSSCSMLYVPESLWKTKIEKPLLKITKRLFVSDATYCDCFYSALIDRKAYHRLFTYLKYIHNNSECKMLIGGTCSKGRGYYVDPTIVLVENLDDFLCKEELLGPILCVYVYQDENLYRIMDKITEVNHALTASIFAQDNQFIRKACEIFKSNVGNLNINDKCTGLMVGQQPFGAGQLTGSNEKLGSPQYLLRWTSPQVIKESFVPHVNVYYPYMEISDNILNINRETTGVDYDNSDSDDYHLKNPE
ncbi:PREDICTED: delta-1-pyrroline-5-carboxylate dehydrogenase, mitochondrial [Drosophila arizonae]|uniref:Delta-1-pyrroline-5-carboxylate dehydrogenase, mitochondrial n=1 Tax=Drosophila arizonae TaxID=7263 RepID=A0ABM1Q424_DROAR|nr:PREDICTED: delta-1-pyrroline-5-carboxylate dehydrogenase, mitochondrial [Drosophila arizonae]XP_017874210.1 PREDICTED: delta-1-pyrroline-5-carboxylate dehydrogenase, mitochondrial [Drosophila arizonae]